MTDDRSDAAREPAQDAAPEASRATTQDAAPPRLPCFKAYDIRGRVGRDLDADLFERVGRAYAQVFGPASVVTGRDARDSSPELQAALNRGLSAAGVDVVDLGLCGTEEVYFATEHLGAGGGMMITASHNPKGDNGMKIVREGARPIPWDGGFGAVHDAAVGGAFEDAETPGTIRQETPRAAYVDRVLSFVDVAALRPLKVLVNAGNGAAGPTFDALADALVARGAPLEVVRKHHAPDPDFPNGIPNPLLPENRPATADDVVAHGCDLGVAWDGDFDRCFFFDAEGGFVPGEIVVALLARAMLARSAGGEAIVHDPRVIWNTQAVVAQAGGRSVASRTGHALIKAAMREEDAVYGGEMSAHHYFRDFMYCDSGMVPFVLMLDLMSGTGRSLAQLWREMAEAYPSSGEMNFRLEDVEAAFAAVEARFLGTALEVDRLDGLSLTFRDWRMNLRRSNTEPVVRLNLETRGDRALLEDRVAAVTAAMGVAPPAGG
ncbi:MAG: phosphomannomutase [Shimia sp.]